MKQLKAKILCTVVAVLVMASAQTNHNTSATEKNSNLQSTNSVESHTKGEYASVNKAEAVNTLRVAESGNARAQNELGKYYANRNGGVTNIEASAKVATDPTKKESADRNIISFQERVAAAERALARRAASHPTLDAPRGAQADAVRRASEMKRMINEETAERDHATNPSKFLETPIMVILVSLGGLLLKSRSTLLRRCPEITFTLSDRGIHQRNSNNACGAQHGDWEKPRRHGDHFGVLLCTYEWQDLSIS